MTLEEIARLDAEIVKKSAKSRQRIIVQRITAEQLLDQFADAAKAMLDALNRKGDLDVAAHQLRDVLSIVTSRQRRRETVAAGRPVCRATV